MVTNGSEQDQQNTQTQDSRITDDITEFGTSLACLFVSVFFVFCAVYLGPYPNLTLGTISLPINSIVKWGCFVLAVVCFVLFIGFWAVAMGNAPQMSQFFKAIWGGGERGWHYASQTVVLLIVAFVIHLFAALLSYLGETTSRLGWLEYVAWSAQLPVIILALFAFVMLAYSCDAFFIRPILNTTSEGGKRFQTLVDNVRKRGTVVIPILLALVTLYIEAFR